MRNCQRVSLLALALAGATTLSACNNESAPKPNATPTENVTGAKFALTGSGDTVALEFQIARVSCVGEPITPWAHIERVPLQAGSITDHFMLLEPGCYDATVQPLDASGTPSEDCSAAAFDQLTIIDGYTTEAGVQIECKGKAVGAADLWVLLNTPPHISDVTFDPDKFVSHCDSQTICVEFTEPDGAPVEIEWHQRSGIPLAAVPTPGAIQYDPTTGKSTQCATLEHSGVGTVGLEVIAFDMMALPGGGLVRVEDYYASRGFTIQSRDSLQFPSHGTIGANCACAPGFPEICDTFDNDCDGQNNEGATCACMPFEVERCYDGPVATAGVGECRIGGRPCLLDGSGYDTVCHDQILPQAEQCNGKDDDCNGTVDDGLPGCVQDCVAPGSQACAYTGPVGTENVGVCRGGTQICLADGSWSSCIGEVLPSTEVVNGQDDDCDGQVDEVCVSAGTQIGAAYCSGPNLVADIANGSCGTYQQVVEYNSMQCLPPSSGAVSCWYAPDLHCTYSPSADGLARWQYSYSTGQFGPWYTSGDSVNWGNCYDPAGGASFSITIEATNSSGAGYTSMVAQCAASAP